MQCHFQLKGVRWNTWHKKILHKVNCKSNEKTLYDVIMVEWCDWCFYYCFSSVSSSSHFFWSTDTTNTQLARSKCKQKVCGLPNKLQHKKSNFIALFCLMSFSLIDNKSSNAKKKKPKAIYEGFEQTNKKQQ